MAVAEEVPDHLHRRALIQEVLGRGMPKGVGPASAGDDADARQPVADHLAQGFSGERPDRRVRREEETAPEAGRPRLPDVAQDGVADALRQRP